MRRWTRNWLVLLSLTAAPALAHEGSDRAMGVVASVTPSRIVIRAADGHSLAFDVTPETLVTRGERPARLDEVRVGERAAVQGKRVGESVQALRVRLGAAPAAR